MATEITTLKKSDVANSIKNRVKAKLVKNDLVSNTEKSKELSDKSKELKVKAKEVFNKMNAQKSNASARSSYNSMNKAMSKVSDSQRQEWEADKKKRTADSNIGYQKSLRVATDYAHKVGKEVGSRNSDEKWKKRIETLKGIQRKNSGIKGWIKNVKLKLSEEAINEELKATTYVVQHSRTDEIHSSHDDLKSAKMALAKAEDKTGYVHNIHAVKDGKIMKSWEATSWDGDEPNLVSWSHHRGTPLITTIKKIDEGIVSSWKKAKEDLSNERLDKAAEYLKKLGNGDIQKGNKKFQQDLEDDAEHNSRNLPKAAALTALHPGIGLAYAKGSMRNSHPNFPKKAGLLKHVGRTIKNVLNKEGIE